MRKARVVGLGLAFLLAALPVILLVGAAEPSAVNGNYRPIGAPTFSDDRVAGKSDNGFIDVSLPVMWMGPIAGFGVNAMHWIAHNEATPEEVVIIHGVTTLTTNIAVFGVPKTGTLTIKIYNVVSAEGTEGLWRIIGGTGDLAGLHGGGSLAEISPMPNVVIGYSGQIHFDP